MSENTNNGYIKEIRESLREMPELREALTKIEEDVLEIQADVGYLRQRANTPR